MKKRGKACKHCQFNGEYSKAAQCKLDDCCNEAPNPIKPKKPKKEEAK